MRPAQTQRPDSSKKGGPISKKRIQTGRKEELFSSSIYTPVPQPWQENQPKSYDTEGTWTRIFPKTTEVSLLTVDKRKRISNAVTPNKQLLYAISTALLSVHVEKTVYTKF